MLTFFILLSKPSVFSILAHNVSNNIVILAFLIMSTSFRRFFNNFYIISCLYVVYYCLKKEEIPKCNGNKNCVDFDFFPNNALLSKFHSVLRHFTST